MLNEHDQKMIDDAFAGHSLIKNSESKSWLMQNPDSHGYWFRVTWCPGSLSVSGDVGEIVLTHYQAMPTWQDAVKWVRGACHGYLMQKSNKERHFDEEDTVKQVINMANEQLECGDSDIWEKLARDTGIPIEDKEGIADEISLGFFESAQDVYEFMDDADWTGTYKYDIETHFLYKALQIWADEVYKGIAQ
jgi:hypothetical protein